MSFLTRVLGLDAPTSPGLPVDPNAPLPAANVGETESVHRIAAKLTDLPPARARYIAAFAYLLGRAANANLAVSDAEAEVMQRLIVEVGQVDTDTATMVVDLARLRADRYGATEDYLVSREFKAISTMEERERLLRCCFVVMAADDEVDATESWLANRLAEELDIERPDLNRIRDEFHDQLSGVREVRKLAAN
jgi:uncharacterized tellurite resistance protein B-like protein